MWIKSEPSKWKAFVGNRVSEIQEITSPSKWYHCSGKENPADLLTRGILAQELISSKMWLNGPAFLVEKVCEIFSQTEENVEISEENVASEISLVVCDNHGDKIFDVERWGSFIKSISVVGWVLRFIQNSQVPKRQQKTGDLSFEELEVAKVRLFCSIQREEYGKELAALKHNQPVARSSSIYRLPPYLREDGLLRVQGRLEFPKLTYEEKHPIILPKSHLSLLLVRHQHKLLKHAGVATMITSLRGQFWIVGL